MYVFFANSDLIGIELVSSAARPSASPCTRTRNVSRTPLNASTCDVIRERAISIQNRAGQFDRGRNQIRAAELKRDLLKDSRRLHFRAAIGDALDGLETKFP